MSNFEWDEHKNRANQQKHGIPFEEAKEVFDDDNQIQYDPDFDDMTWGKPIPFKQLKQALETGDQLPETAELILKLRIGSTDMRQWLMKNGEQINIVVSALLESMYKADKLAQQKR